MASRPSLAAHSTSWSIVCFAFFSFVLFPLFPVRNFVLPTGALQALTEFGSVDGVFILRRSVLNQGIEHHIQGSLRSQDAGSS